MLNRSHVATIWNFDPNDSLPNVTQVSLPKMFQIVATWLEFSTEEYVGEIWDHMALLTEQNVFYLHTMLDCKKRWVWL